MDCRQLTVQMYYGSWGRLIRRLPLPDRTEKGLRSDHRRRYEGVRVKHWSGKNSLKIYNKAGNILGVETTINDPRSFKVFRQPNDDPSRTPSWQRMRKGVADLHRRSQVSQRSNERYLESLVAAKTDEKVKEVFDEVSQRVESEGKTFRALNLFKSHDYQLLSFLAKGEWNINGFRNRDLCNSLGEIPVTEKERKRLCGRVSRQIRLLRAHGLVRKVPHTHRYVLTKKGMQLYPLVRSFERLDSKTVMDKVA